MEDPEILAAISKYREKFVELGIPKTQMSTAQVSPARDELLAHCHWMLDSIPEFLRTARRGKVNRWIGFVQGCLSAYGVYAIDDLKEHNRPQ